ncbi:GPI-anchored wall transfer protein [Paramyrothecium foliicola]|nr:GPI-anchored wall transfer protein [Paramyrothecium foliicola]
MRIDEQGPLRARQMRKGDPLQKPPGVVILNTLGPRKLEARALAFRTKQLDHTFMMPDAQSYKQQKEDFVSNLSGGTVSEINYVTAVAPGFFKNYSLLGFSVDYLLNVGAILLATTLYANSPILLNLLLLAPAALVYVLPPDSSSRKKKPRVPPNAQSKVSAAQSDALPLKPFLTTYRGCMLVITCLAILAVDFRVFPRRFAKAETWGTSLMDLGVGSFVFSAGVVAARAVLKEKMKGRATSLPRRMLGSLRHSIPLLVLGFIRLLSVKGLDYAEHVTEYGVHWNFFFTLGILPIFVAAFQAALSILPSYSALSLLVGGTYQALLETTDLKAYILTAARTDLLSMNREGVFSFLGYLAIFLAGQDLGMLVLPRKINPRSDVPPGMQRNTLIMTIAVWAGIWVGLYYISTDYKYGFGWSVSRRLANLPYVLWVAAFNSVQLLAFCIIDSVFFPAFYNATDVKTEKEAYETATSPVLRAFNRNSLALFLLANLLTGLVNMTVRTLEATPVVSVAILLAYSATVTGVAVVLDRYEISIRL